MRRSRFTIITDIPTPYRVYFFNQVFKELEERNIDFDVMFMAKTVPIRYWKMDASTWKFPYKIAKGLHLYIGANSFHFNPGIIFKMLFEPPTWVLIGGAWNIPTSFLSILLVRMFHKKKCTSLLWSEANKYSMSHKTGIVAKLRKYITNSADMFAVPGRLAIDTLSTEGEVKDGQFLMLPNLIDERKHTQQSLCKDVMEIKKKYTADFLNENKDVVLLWPARLHEKTKGILNFLQSVEELINGSQLKILIAGDGPDRIRIENWIRERLPNNVMLLGQKTEDEMLELYSICDVLLLPSLSDPNPLSVIEGLWSSLPLLISKHCGNYIEAVKAGCNGWVVDPLSPDTIRDAIIELKNMNKLELREYGANSLEIANDKYNSVLSIQKFFDELIGEKPRNNNLNN